MNKFIPGLRPPSNSESATSKGSGTSTHILSFYGGPSYAGDAGIYRDCPLPRPPGTWSIRRNRLGEFTNLSLCQIRDTLAKSIARLNLESRPLARDVPNDPQELPANLKFNVRVARLMLGPAWIKYAFADNPATSQIERKFWLAFVKERGLPGGSNALLINEAYCVDCLEKFYGHLISLDESAVLSDQNLSVQARELVDVFIDSFSLALDQNRTFNGVGAYEKMSEHLQAIKTIFACTIPNEESFAPIRSQLENLTKEPNGPDSRPNCIDYLIYGVSAMADLMKFAVDVGAIRPSPPSK